MVDVRVGNDVPLCLHRFSGRWAIRGRAFSWAFYRNTVGRLLFRRQDNLQVIELLFYELHGVAIFRSLWRARNSIGPRVFTGMPNSELISW